MEAHDSYKAIESVFRIERARLIAGLVRFVKGDVGLAEDLAQEALVAALSQWPGGGIPGNPGAWLMAIAKRRAVDHFRRREMIGRKHEELARETGRDKSNPFDEIEAAMDDDIGDERLSLIFAACHPALSLDARVALTLKLIGGLSTTELARAFLTSETTISQRIVRAKKALGMSDYAYEVPSGSQRDERLAAVLEVIFLIFNEGYAATAGEDVIRPQLCSEAMRLGRILAAFMPEEPEVHGLLALMEIQSSRLDARTAPDGTPIPITEQNRARWDRLLIQRGLASLARAEELGGANRPYALQAALGACHARANTPKETDWTGIAGLYDRLRVVMPSPVVDLGRAVAHSMAFGPETGLALLEELKNEPSPTGFVPLPAARADFLFRAGRLAEAESAFREAANLSRVAGEKNFLLKRAAACLQQQKNRALRSTRLLT